MVVGVRETEDAVKILKKEIHRPRTGDLIKVSPRTKEPGGVFKTINPLNNGHDIIRVQTKKTLRESVWVKITADDFDNPGTIIAELIEKDDKDIQEKSFFTSNRDTGIEWAGTPQNTSSDSTENRSKVFTEGDSRGSKNDLLGGNL